VSALSIAAPTSSADACAACEAPLRPTARYCLVCGTRRAGTRPEFLDVLEAGTPVVAPFVASAPRGDGPQAWPFALLGVVLLALLVGLLAGHQLGDRHQPATTPVIRVVGASPSTAAPAASSAATAATTASTATPSTTAAAPATGTP
jgi:hypothetical protein